GKKNRGALCRVRGFSDGLEEENSTDWDTGKPNIKGKRVRFTCFVEGLITQNGAGIEIGDHHSVGGRSRAADVDHERNCQTQEEIDEQRTVLIAASPGCFA